MASNGGDDREFVFVPGIGVSGRYFEPVARRLMVHAPVAVFLPAGFAGSPNPHRDVSIADHAEALDQFLSARNISNPVLIGHSMGTEIVVTLARDHPERSNRLVLLAPTMDPNARRFWQAAGRLLHDVFVAEHPAVAFIATIDYFRTGVPYFLKQTKHLLADRIEDSLTRISAPTLVLRGDRDVVSPLEWCEAVTSLLPQGTFVPVKGPHVMWYSDPDRVTELILEHANG